MRQPIRQRPAFIVRGDGDRTRSMGHRESIGTAAVEAAIEAGNKHKVVTCHRCSHVERSGIGAGSITHNHAIGRPDANPGTKVIVIRDLADVHGDPVTHRGCERPHIHIAFENLPGVDGPVGERPSLITV